MTDESPIGLWHWLVMLVVFNAYWILDDLWLRAHGHETLTREAHEILEGGGWKGRMLAVGVAATLGLFLFHFFYERGS